MATIDISRQRKSLLEDAIVLDHLPSDLLAVIKDESESKSQPTTTNTKILDAVSEAALTTKLTEHIFVHFESIFPDICARWILTSGDFQRKLNITSALARILPFSPYLATFLEEPLQKSAAALYLPLPKPQLVLQHTDEKGLLNYLITIWRLLNFNLATFGRHISPAFAQELFSHTSPPVRYVSVRIFCLLLRASDYKLEALIDKHLGTQDAIIADLDGRSLDYGFLTLHEQERVNQVISLRDKVTSAQSQYVDEPLLQVLTSYVVSYGNALLPRPSGPIGDLSSLVLTSTTTSNLETLASMLQKSDPILLHGLPGSGKTSLVHEVAKSLGMYSGMVTLHLNEQTDAKMLIGLYSTDSKPGSFQWRPGVLTTAVREGRWVLVEDLDRAPTEVLSTLLPLIERNELLIPSRGERIQAASSFRLFATLRTTRGMNGRENLPSIVGMRFWQSMHTQPLKEPELEEVVFSTYPILKKFVPGIIAVHNRLSKMDQNAIGGRSMGNRGMNTRDLLKWCRRLRECLSTAGSTTGDEPITETTRDWMFMEALDCFIGSCPDAQVAKKMVYAIAEEMHMSSERAEHYIDAYIPPLEENEANFNVGRVRLRKQRMPGRVQKSKRPFASTSHAKKLLEQIAIAVKLSEPVLLVGETGIGKTTVVQQLADCLGHKLIAVNLSQQSEVGDLLGGFKPVNVRTLAMPLKEDFEDLFTATGISVSKNQKYFEQVGKCFAKGQWSKVSKLWKEAPKMFHAIITQLQQKQLQEDEVRNGDDQPAKRRKTQSKLQSLVDLRPRWDAFSRRLEQFDVQISGGANSFAFSFMEGNLVKAVRNGDWVLLDEINLASPDTLESIADLLSGPSERPSILLSETGEIEKVVAHPNFRIFGAMNPATDIGKRDLPTGIRSRFTELYVRSPDADLKDLLTIIKTYLGSSSGKIDQAADDIARLYMNTKRMAEERRLVDGANEVPHFSLRTLTRVLSFVNTISPSYGLRRALYEGFSMGFLTLLDRDSEKMLMPLIYHHVFNKQGNPQSLLSQSPKHPNDGKQYVRFKNKNQDRQYWLFQGAELIVQRDDYIITPYVERNLLNVVRATSTRRFPILIQGPTSAGKTSMIEYLANFTGNKFVRINNHEHTDLQEYLGTYISGADGKLKFQEGLLVQAMRQGHWIVLDELNLAPTDVLEALNRLLDDNRELLIPETQEVVRPHENFILFATQNPPGLYGGRKVLSRAFRNRFLELHFDDIPEDELEFILQQRSRKTAPSDCRRIVTVYKELSRLRQTSRLFEQKDSFATLRDLFRWALRKAENREEIATHGFMLLAERVRNEEERLAVKEVIERVFKVKIDPQHLYSADEAPELRALTQKRNGQGVVWTHAMRRLYVLVARALRNNEPVLLVGETGCGKTTVCQLLAEALSKELHIVNAHQNTETGDLIGSQRPIRNRGAIIDTLNTDLGSALNSLGLEISGSVDERLARYSALDSATLDSLPHDIRQRISDNETRSKALFEWSDGALVEAMKGGHFFLLDEISLADDSVLERLNSVLEPQRTLLLAEKGVDNSFVTATQGFQMFATMNPGGDFGKKELSPALRNRFTEIWVPPLSDNEDIFDIVGTKLVDGCKDLVETIVNFASWFGETFRSMASTKFSIREILVWVNFINTFHDKGKVATLLHGASTVFIDSIGANPSALIASDHLSISDQRMKCVKKLGDLIGQDLSSLYQSEPLLLIEQDSLSIGDFTVPRNPTGSGDPEFAFHALTTRLNGMRVLRALQMQKPILLEGSPGVGKTTLVAALARTCGQPLTRINLSDQTDLMDLFGTDVPVEGAEAGNFAWRDAPFLQAMQKGEWVLLDEMNLASQSVLEGLNACLDHRGEVYISELDQVFKRHPNFRLFAAQNPHHQGGGRKGLPASFVNRFVVVYADVFTDDDLKLIAAHNFPHISEDVVSHLIQFISRIEDALTRAKSFGAQGGPWEFNLRDVLRWLNLLSSSDDLLKSAKIDDFLDLIVRQRFRTQKDRDEIDTLFESVTGFKPRPHSLYHNVSPMYGQVGLALLERNIDRQPERIPSIDITARLPELETLMICVKKNIPCILSSPSGYGKSVLLEHVAALAGKPLVVFPMNADIDTMDLVGGFEQADPLREVNAILVTLKETLQKSVMQLMPSSVPSQALSLLHLLEGTITGNEALSSIHSAIETLMDTIPADSEVGKVLTTAHGLLSGPLTLSNPRFEWLDGVIIKALQTGQWLVLDNANMCNASVLDRLNSLLEPNGFLSINEHCEPGGEPRIVRPHRDFRIFLTVDPRYGELSRAMRNRAVEIYIHAPPLTVNPYFAKISPVEGRLDRLLTLQRMCRTETSQVSIKQLVQVATDHLSLQDTGLAQRFARHLSVEVNNEEVSQVFGEFLAFAESPTGSKSLTTVSNLYEKAAASSPMALSYSQPIHPLINSNFTRILPQPEQSRWLAARYEFSRCLYGMTKLLEGYHRQAQASKLNALNRLQRSLVSDRVAAVAKDSTVKLASFLNTVITMTCQYLSSDPISTDYYDGGVRVLRFVSHYLARTMSLTHHDEFDEARFLAHLAHGTDTIEKYIQSVTGAERDLMVAICRQIGHDFDTGFKLSTGLSMDLLWLAFRPTPMRDEGILKSALELEKLCIRFDALRWKTSASIDDLCNASATLEKAYNIVKSGTLPAEDLVNDLAAEIGKLEASIGIDSPDVQPLFADEFENLRQVSLLKSVTSRASSGAVDTHLAMLSNTPTQVGMLRADPTQQGQILHAVNVLACQDKYFWDGKFASSLWSKIEGIGSVNLGSLALLEVELPILGRHIAHLTADIIVDPLIRLNDILVALLLDVLEAHGSSLRAAATNAISKCIETLRSDPAASFDTLMNTRELLDLEYAIQVPHLRDIATKHFIPAIIATTVASLRPDQRAYFSALAWNHFSVGTIILYVPDRVFDPQIRPQIEREFIQDVHSDLKTQIQLLRSFETTFTRQESNARIQFLEREIEQMGPLPEAVQPVFRPKKSDLSQLHAEFSNILRAASSLSLESGTKSLSSDSCLNTDNLALIKENVQRLIARLSTRFEAYQDMTVPTINLLRCLLVGLSLCGASSSTKLATSTQDLLQVTPFFGGSSWNSRGLAVPAKSFEFLHLAALSVAVQGIENVHENLRTSIFECFHYFYEDWRKRLEADQKEREANTSLYVFKGSAEDEEEVDAEQFQELFPTFDEDDQDDDNKEQQKPVAKKVDQVRDMSIKVAHAHRRLFLESKQPMSAVSDLCSAVGRKVAEDVHAHGFIDRGLNARMLASTMLLLNEKKQVLSASTTDKAYNFYTSENLPEARLLVILANKIKKRFRELQLIDEIGHMQPLADVIQHCDALMDLTHTKSLAKILPKIEQLHAVVYEWQFGGWASKIYAVLDLYNSLTDTIIRWRRLELSTWAHLFDMERNKCEDDAYSWWFIAYQVVVAVPLTMIDSATELKAYAVSLIENLELYFSTSIIGQFSTRLALLKQLRKHLQLLMKDYPTLEVIYHSVSNFISYYVKFQKQAEDAIQRGRSPIDKKMKDVLLMASWKDTNINALRESAKKSHQKLFRLVRKFRSVLGQEMKDIIANGLPDQDLKLCDQPGQLELTPIDSSVAVKIKSIIPSFFEQNKRLANASRTVSIMAQITQNLAIISNAPMIIDNFITSLDTSMADLRKETPSFLTEENTEQVKHLKTRKRGLFADTLKDLRLMGLRYNLSQNRLSEQESLAVVLSSLVSNDSAAGSALDVADYYFHRTLDLAPKIRAAAREHSEDLTSAEVARSIGFVEGMIHMLMAQRRGITAAIQSWTTLDKVIEKLRYFSATKNEGLLRRNNDCGLAKNLQWLVQILHFAIQLVEIHGNLGDMKHESVLLQLRTWATKFAEHSSKFQLLDTSIEGVITQTRQDLETSISMDSQLFLGALEQMSVEQPMLAFILQEIAIWSQVDEADIVLPEPQLDVVSFVSSVSTVCDKVLVAVENAKKASLAVPSNEEHVGWLVGHNDAFETMVKKLRISEVAQNVDSCLELLCKVDLKKPEVSTTCKGAIILAGPILEQFGLLCKQSVDQLLQLHRASSHMAFNLTRAFNQLSSQGFCTPQEKSDETTKDAKVEAGTGLGDGEGAEDISKDIQDDEDLSELAQEANKEQNGEMEDEKDAVDMADEELEGDMGSVDGEEDEDGGSKKGDEEEEEDDMDEEAGDVDDLDPTAVDEKMWDGEDEDKADKDQQGDKSKGQQQPDEQMAAEEDSKADGAEEQEEDKKPDGPDEADDEQAGDEEEEDVKAQEELNKQEQTAQENETLALPEDMELDLDEESVSGSDDEDMNALSDVEDDKQEAEAEVNDQDDGDDDKQDDESGQPQDNADAAAEDEEEKEDPEGEDEAKVNGEDEVQDEVEPEEEETEETTQEQAPPPTNDNAETDKDNTAPSDVKSSGQDQTGEAMDLDDEFRDNAAQQEDGEMGQAAADQQASAGNKGSTTKREETAMNNEQDKDKDDTESARSDPFKKLGDALERWHRQQSDIQDANPDEGEAEQKNQPDAQEQTKKEFQHLQNDESAVDAQALGTANDDEVQPIDESMAIDEEKEDPSSRVMEADDENKDEEIVDKMEDNDQTEETQDKDNNKNQDDGRSGVKTRQGNFNREQTPIQEDQQMVEDENEDEVIEETSTQLETTHLDTERELRDFGECMQQWVDFQSKTHALSLSLTSQLRLILTPSQSTKLSGSFRTGKRLNIKRIIPYIASSYKRDKIWMRRAIPTKRTYQILLCVDDSKSMGESSSGTLAMESLVMVSRSLTMLEAGQVGIVGFGADVFTAHDLTDPFAADAGAKVLQKFNFSQDRTDIALLIRQTIDRFRTARQQQSGGNSDLWQLSLILSDGLTPSSAHDGIRRLLREAMEERIMIVFIIMDDTEKKKGDSVLELKEAKFVREDNGESRVVIERYLDTFPFQYYLIVHNLEDLPGALAGLLRTWFSEVSS